MMEVKLYVMEVGNRYYVSGTIYTPNGIKSYDDVFDSFELIYSIQPTFATRIVASSSMNKITSHYYLTYDSIENLKKMLSFMVGSPAEYLSFIPISVIKELGIQVDKSTISFSHADIPPSQSIPCNIIGSIYTPVFVSNNKIYFNNVPIGNISENGDVFICGYKVMFIKDLGITLKIHVRKMILCYLRETHKYFITWDDILKMWCGIKILSMT